MFRPRIARRALERYRRRGPDELELGMMQAALDTGIDGARVLEIGGGLGTIGSELLAAGAAESEVVELVAAWEPYALELARERGLEGQTRFRVVDILDRPGEVEPADLVVLNRVVCCTPDGVALTAEAASHARRALVLSFPRDVFWVRAAMRGLNAGMWLLRRSYRAFVHPPAALLAAAEAKGLRPAADGRRGVVWQYAALTRPRP
ncbi:MAG TPA: class I SAM-dependent methyltransferase [Gaiellaceae bacterium]|nr:class I SAM-dependent methyltransferase [Gaiellaceae bacterium]